MPNVFIPPKRVTTTVTTTSITMPRKKLLELLRLHLGDIPNDAEIFIGCGTKPIYIDDEHQTLQIIFHRDTNDI